MAQRRVRGLFRKYSVCQRLLALGAPLYEQLAAISSIDPGEAQLFAVSATSGVRVMTGDKRALDSLKQTPEALNALSGRSSSTRGNTNSIM